MAQKFERDTRHVNIEELCKKIELHNSKDINSKDSRRVINKQSKDLGR